MTARPTKSRRTKLSALAVSALVALTGCGAVHPGMAAVVGSSTISHDRVDTLASALCTARTAGSEAAAAAAPPEPTRRARGGALQILLETELSHEFGEERGVDPSLRQVTEALAQQQQLIDFLPEDEAEAYREALAEYAEGQLMLIEIGRQSLEEQGQSNVPDDQALAEGERLRQEYAESLEIEVDPRYGTFEDGSLSSGGTALSVAESDRAKAGSQAELAPTFVSGLPASQRCAS
ncbi:MAG TPA: hypothetical protein VFQ19_03345 [Nocardioidaceae bacterium]|nr:hypothetical protein [Nocardioidaceae bacterium]